MTAETLSTAEVARILRMPASRIRELVRAGLCRPARRGHRYMFSFQDLVVLRTAQGLLQHNVQPSRVGRALRALVQELPQDRPLSGLRIYADGRHVAVREAGTRWHPETGQTLLDFEVDELAERVEELRRSGPARPEGAGERELERALELEGKDSVAARAAYRRALELDPELVDAYVNLGRLVHEAGDAPEAVRLYHLALERSSRDPVLHFNLAVALEDTRGASPAAAHYERALELDPEFADAHYNLAGLCEQLGRPTEALRHYHAYKKLTEP
ncbi:MAG: tetratricopeptide repeat protein [Myxococcota bacterium]